MLLMNYFLCKLFFVKFLFWVCFLGDLVVDFCVFEFVCWFMGVLGVVTANGRWGTCVCVFYLFVRVFLYDVVYMRV